MSSTPQRKRFNREQRLQSAKDWVKTFAGKNIFRYYRKYYGVDWQTTFTELEMLGFEISPTYKEAVFRSVEVQRLTRQKKKAAMNPLRDDQDENFALVIGYTSGEAPYGLTREEMKALEAE